MVVASNLGCRIYFCLQGSAIFKVGWTNSQKKTFHSPKMEKQHLFAKKTFDSCFIEWENSTCFIQKVLIDLHNQKQEYECSIYLSEVWGGLLNTPIVSLKVHISDPVMHILKSWWCIINHLYLVIFGFSCQSDLKKHSKYQTALLEWPVVKGTFRWNEPKNSILSLSSPDLFLINHPTILFKLCASPGCSILLPQLELKLDPASHNPLV